MNTARKTATGFGLQTAAIVAGGEVSGDAGITTVEAYDGTNWTAVNDMQRIYYANASSGTQTNGLVFGGAPGAGQSGSQQWDGTNWRTSAS